MINVLAVKFSAENLIIEELWVQLEEEIFSVC
jgi:hypothetical protein